MVAVVETPRRVTAAGAGPAPVGGAPVAAGPGPGSLLGRQVATGLRWSAVNTVLTRVGQMAVGVVLARLVAPEDFGVFATALVAFSLVMSVSEMGVTVALLRWPGDPREIAPTVTTLALASAVTLAAACAGAAAPVAAALGAPEAAPVLRVLALAVLVAGPSAVPMALLQRAFRQDRRMVADQANLVVSTVVAVVLALRGHGAMSLAWSRVAGNAVSAVLLIVMAPARPLPGFDRDRARELLATGLPLAGASLVVFAILNVDYVVVGSALGPVALGFYLMAFNLSSWPVNAFSSTVRPVSVAGFSRLLDDPSALGAAFARALGRLLGLTFPVCALLATLGGPLVRVVYGPRWGPAAAALAGLALLGAARVALELAYDFLAAVGASRSLFRLQVGWLAALVPALAVGARAGGIRGVAVAHVAVAVLVVGPAHLRALLRAGVGARLLGARLVRPLAAGAGAAAVALGAGALTGSDVVRLLVGGTAGVAVAGLVVLPDWRAAGAIGAVGRDVEVPPAGVPAAAGAGGGL